MQPGATWVIVADGGGARFFVRSRQGLPLQEIVELAESADALERRGGEALAHDRVGHGRHAVTARFSPHERAENVFLRHVAGQIDRAVIENAVEKLVLCAPPHALGLIRDYLSENARSRVTEEIPKDLLREKIADIDERLKAHRI